MKKRWHLMVVLVILLVGGIVWLILSAAPVGSPVALTLITNSPSQSASGMLFVITNGDERAILLTDLIVETNSPEGWQAFSHTTPTHPQRLATGDTKDLAIPPPNGEKSWRLRVTYGRDVKGPLLFLGKASFAISQHKWPGQGFGVMAGSNSCISGVMMR
ncbi:MAG TPA: hypothetical protein VGO67_06310 [Verrucomicrobiae bacterium]|jgi:hypothetical protein